MGIVLRAPSESERRRREEEGRIASLGPRGSDWDLGEGGKYPPPVLRSPPTSVALVYRTTEPVCSSPSFTPPPPTSPYVGTTRVWYVRPRPGPRSTQDRRWTSWHEGGWSPLGK